ncbi:MAG: TrlF family AAA-like ATPase, partial [Verrucomicrobiota bacterium]
MNIEVIPGSKWWKCDLHVHTPHSTDYADKSVTPEQIVKAALDKKLSAIAVTDHNGFEMIDKVRQAAKAAGDQLTVFSGVEISALDNCHLLVIFGTDTPGSTVNGFLGACGILKNYGDPMSGSNLSYQQIFQKAFEQSAVCIPAHSDDARGLLKELVKLEVDGSLRGNNHLLNFLGLPELCAIEVKDDQSPLLAYLENAKSSERFQTPLTWIENSDAHSLTDIGCRATWIKMTTPSLEGLKLALWDGAGSVLRERKRVGDLNQPPVEYIESIEISKARYVGMETPLRIPLSPWLTTLIGGRGTGKSTAIEFLRRVMRREGEHEKLSEELKEQYGKYKRTYKKSAPVKDIGLLRPETKISLIVRKDSSRFQINWSEDGKAVSVEEDVNGQWQPTVGDVASRFPVRIFSQKQIFELANRPNALLVIIDQSNEIGKDMWAARFNQAQNEFFQIRLQIRQLAQDAQQRTVLQGKMADLIRQVAAFEAGQHRETLLAYQTLGRQQRALELWQEGFAQTVQSLGKMPEQALPPDLSDGVFPSNIDPQSPMFPVLEAVGNAKIKLQEISRSIAQLVEDARKSEAEFKTALSHPIWLAHVDSVRKAYEDLKAQLAASGVHDISQYGRLVQEKQTTEAALKQLDAKQKLIVDLQSQSAAKLVQLSQIRKELTEARKNFLAKVLQGNSMVSIDVSGMGDEKDAAVRLRSVMGIGEDERFSDSLDPSGETGALGDVFKNIGVQMESKWRDLKSNLLLALQGSENPQFNGKFKTFLQNLSKNTPEAMDRVATCFPEDKLIISYTTADSSQKRQVEEGSPGQK